MNSNGVEESIPKIKIRVASKRKAIIVENSEEPVLGSEIKKRKMEAEEAKLLIQAAVEKTSLHVTEIVKSQLQENLKPIQDSIRNIEDNHARIEATAREHSERLDIIEEQLANSSMAESNLTQLKQDIISELRTELEGSTIAAYKLALAREVEKHECNLIIHGMKNGAGDKEVKDLLVNMKIPSDFIDKVNFKARTLGKVGVGAAKSPSILISFANPFERNTVLGHSSNLPKDIRVDKDIPMAYREAFKRFKRAAWRHRQLMKVKTQIGFVGHLMQLKYRDNDDPNKAYTILEEYFPPPAKQLASIPGNVSKPNSAPSTSLTASKLAEASKWLIIGNNSGLSLLDLESKLSDVLSKEHRKLILAVEMKGNIVVAVCKDRETCKLLAEKYNGKKKGNFTLNISSE